MRLPSANRQRQPGPWHALLAAAALATGCGELLPIAEGDCGNDVVESSNIEDCDCGSDAKAANPEAGNESKTCAYELGGKQSLQCNLPGKLNACRFACSTQSECPDGWGCGDDHVCRQPTGGIRLLGGALSADTDRILTGDFDGNGKDDLLAVGASGVTVAYSQEAGARGTVASISTNGIVPAPGRLTGLHPDDATDDALEDRTDDLVYGVGLGLSVFEGQPGQTFAPVSFPTISHEELSALGGLAPDMLDIVASRRLSADEGKSADLYAILADAGPLKPPVLRRLIRGKAVATSLGYGEAKIDLAQMQGSGFTSSVSGDLDGDGAPEVLLVAPEGTAISVFAPFLQGNTIPAPSQVALRKNPLAPAEQARALGRMFLQDVDGDQDLDLIIAAICPGAAGMNACLELELAQNQGGTLAAATLLMPLPTAMTMGPSHIPLAVGDFNGDGVLDTVDSFGVNMGSAKPGSEPELAIANTGFPWTEAVVADLNADGRLDVLAGSGFGPDLVFLTGDGAGLFGVFTVPTQGPVSAFALGDFDGDVLPDVAFAEGKRSLRGPMDMEPAGDTSVEAQSLAVCFGRAYQPPTLPVRMGELGQIKDLTPLSLTPFGADAAVDLGVVFGSTSTANMEDPNLAIAMISGSGSRQLQSPKLLASGSILGNDLGLARPLRLFTGRFDDGPSETAHDDVVALGIRDDALQLWLIPATEEANLGTPVSATIDPAIAAKIAVGGGKYRFVDGIAVDLDGDEREELVFVTPGVETVGTLLVASFDGTTIELDPGKLVGLTHLYERFRASDIDGDGNIDLLAVGYTVDNKGQRNPDEELTILWGTGGAALCSGTCATTKLTVPGLRDADIFNLDVDPTKEVVAVGTEGIRVLDVQDKQFVENEMIPIAAGKGWTAVRRCDVQGDGVDDIALATQSNLYVYEQVPKLR